MKKTLLLSAAALLLAGCGAKGPAEITQAQYLEKAKSMPEVEYKTAVIDYNYKVIEAGDEVNAKETVKFTFNDVTKEWETDQVTDNLDYYLENLGRTALDAYEYSQEYTMYPDKYKYYEDFSIILSLTLHQDYDEGKADNQLREVGRFNSDGIMIHYEYYQKDVYSGYVDPEDNFEYIYSESFDITYTK